jgi:hypothetical protein
MVAGLDLAGDAGGRRRLDPQGDAGHPDHAVRRTPGRFLDSVRDHPHGDVLRPVRPLAEVLPFHGLPRLRRHVARDRNLLGHDRHARRRFIGIDQAQGIPLGPAAGAIVAGAYFGDKMSPLSDIPNLAPIASGANLFDNIRHMLWSAVPAFLLGLGVYAVVGLRYGGSAVSVETVPKIMTTLDRVFTFNVVLLLPLVVVFGFALARNR